MSFENLNTYFGWDSNSIMGTDCQTLDDYNLESFWTRIIVSRDYFDQNHEKSSSIIHLAMHYVHCIMIYAVYRHS